MNWILKNKNLPSETSLGGDFAKNKIVSQGLPSEILPSRNFVKNKIVSQGKKLKALLVVLFLVFGFGIFF